MNINVNNTLEFNIILQQLADNALCDFAKEKALFLKPLLSESECKNKLLETTGAKRIIEIAGNPPLTAMKDINVILEMATKGSMLVPEQLTSIALFINTCKRMRAYLKKAENCDISIASYGSALYELTPLYDEIETSIRNNAVDDNASPALRDIRRKIENARISAKAKLDDILRSKKGWFADDYVTTRDGRLVLPVKKEFKNQVAGTVIQTSSTGSTYFIEPTAVRKLQEEIALLQIDEDNEIRKILYTLTVLVEENMHDLKINIECMQTLDFVFAKAKLSLQMQANEVPVTNDRRILINQARHPLIKKEQCVPLDFEIGGLINGVIITGPNTGGKTVTLKTVGLLSLMAQSGLHVPVAEGSKFCLHSNILCDIGDGQSISESLSTFSSHIKNIIEILINTTNESLVLLDELGSGTDPAEGMGIAISILDELRKKGCLFIATTHYPEIKDFAKATDKMINARMEFDPESLKPLYKLQIGEAGESCALYIAQRLGFPSHMLKCAYEHAYNKNSANIKQIPVMIFDVQTSEQKTAVVSKIINDTVNKVQEKNAKFTIGDSVLIYPQKSVGIICTTSNDMGNYGVQIKQKKILVNHKRLKLLAPASEMYPENYDFSIIFDTVANRKARHKLSKGHNEELVIEYDDELK